MMSFNKKNLIIILVLMFLCVCFISTVNADSFDYRVHVGEQTTIEGYNPDPLQRGNPDDVTIRYPIYYRNYTIVGYKFATPDQYTIHSKPTHHIWNETSYNPLIISFNKPGVYDVNINLRASEFEEFWVRAHFVVDK